MRKVNVKMYYVLLKHATVIMITLYFTVRVLTVKKLVIYGNYIG